MTTKAEQQHMDRVARLGCVCCLMLGQGMTPATVHHVREGQGMGQRAGHFLTIPLCPACHQGPQGVHGDKTFLRMLKMTELDLLDYTYSLLYPRLR